MMADYSKRVEFLKGLRMADQLVRINSNIFSLPHKHQYVNYSSRLYLRKWPLHKCCPTAQRQRDLTLPQRFSRKLAQSTIMSSEINSFSWTKVTATFLSNEAIYKCKCTADGVRQRAARQSSTGDDLDALVKYHHSMQEKIADDMLSLTKNLKEQTLLASNIITKDIKVRELKHNFFCNLIQN
jgi:Membrane fusion protein Use1